MDLIDTSRTSLTAAPGGDEAWVEVDTGEFMPRLRPATRSLAERIFATEVLASETARRGLVADSGELWMDVMSGESRIRELLQAGDVEAARELASESSARAWYRLLQRPTARQKKQPAGSGFDANRTWLRTRGSQYRGQWVALRDGTLVGHDRSRIALHRSLAGRGSVSGLLFVKLD